MMRRTFKASDLMLVTDPTPREYFGGPDDGKFLPGGTNGWRVDGMYVPINAQRDGQWVVLGMQWVPRNRLVS